MAQWAKPFSTNGGTLVQIPRTHVKPDTVLHICSPSFSKAKLEGETESTGACGPASLVKAVTNKKACLRQSRRQGLTQGCPVTSKHTVMPHEHILCTIIQRIKKNIESYKKEFMPTVVELALAQMRPLA